MENKQPSSAIKSVPILIAFMCMGFGDAVGPFVGLAKEKFTLTNFEAQLIAFMGFIMFFILSIPMGLVQDRTSKKTVLVIGLLIALTGVLIPVFGLEHYSMFLVTVLLLGAGNAVLQVAGNPIMRDVSPEGKYSRNLVLGQFVKAIGSLTGPVIPMIATKYFQKDFQILFPIYAVAILITILSVLPLKVKERKEEKSKPASFSSCFKLLGNGYVLLMVLAIFFYVGAEVCLSSGVPIYLENQFGVNIQEMGLAGTGIFFLALLTGRFLGTVVLNFMTPVRFFIVTCILSLVGMLGLFTGVQAIGFASAFVIGLGFANIFPLVFSIAIDNMPERTNELSGLMVMAIVGGAFLPPLMGFVADKTSVLMGFFVPIAAVLYITYTAIYNNKMKAMKKA